MLAEMIEKIVGLAKSGNQIEVKDLNDRVQLIRCGDSLEQREKLPTARSIKILTAGSFVEFVSDHAQFGDGTVSESADRGSAVYVNIGNSGTSNLIFLFSQFDRRDKAAMPLDYSEAYLAIRELQQPQTPKQLVRTLRTSLHQSMLDPAFLNTVRKIDFRRKNDGSQTNEHGRESMGRSIEMQVQANGGELPEMAGFELAMFSNEGFVFTRKILCALFVDFDNEKISLEPIDDQLNQFIEYTQKRVQETLLAQFGEAKCDVPVYVGSET